MANGIHVQVLVNVYLKIRCNNHYLKSFFIFSWKNKQQWYFFTSPKQSIKHSQSLLLRILSLQSLYLKSYYLFANKLPSHPIANRSYLQVSSPQIPLSVLLELSSYKTSSQLLHRRLSEAQDSRGLVGSVNTIISAGYNKLWRASLGT